MRDCFPSAAARIFTCKGELRLEGENLTFTTTWRTTITIPLKDIEDLSVGQFQMWTTPWVMKYARISFLSLSFRLGGQLQTVHLTPVEPGAVTAGQISACVGRWFERVRQAVKQCTGAVPPASEPASVSVSAEPAWNRKALPLLFGCLLVGLGTWGFHYYVHSTPIWIAEWVLILLPLIGALWFSVTFLRANSALWHGDLDAVTSDDPPAPEPADAGGAGFGAGRQTKRLWLNMAYVGVVAVGLMAALLIGWWGFGGRFSLAPVERGLGSPSAPESEGQFIIYTMPLQSAPRPGELRWNFKYLVPANHLARLMFIRWLNGVPEVKQGGSAYFKVGAGSVVQDCFVSCEQQTVSPDGVVTNSMQWNVSLINGVTSWILLPGEPAYRQLDTPTHLTVRSGYQGVVRLVDEVTPARQSNSGQSGVELRVFLEPTKMPPIRTDPFEVEGTNYVAGHGAGWTADEALKAIKQWPVER